jgi:hypothetical protein
MEKIFPDSQNLFNNVLKNGQINNTTIPTNNNINVMMQFNPNTNMFLGNKRPAEDNLMPSKIYHNISK